MNRQMILCAAICGVLATCFLQNIEAALSPEKVARMKTAATDVFEIEVVEVKFDNEKAIKTNTLITAKIVDVVRAESAAARGETIEIESYEVDGDKLTEGADEKKIVEFIDAVIAPMSPPKIRGGWRGKVYLKANASDAAPKRFHLAAFGHSFEAGESLQLIEATGRKPIVVRNSMIGFRPTQHFYVLGDQHAVLRLVFNGNDDDAFSLGATIYRFNESATQESLSKWVNNQHSDGLYPSVPKPESTVAVPAEYCKVLSVRASKTELEPKGQYRAFDVKFKINAFTAGDQVRFKEFTGAAVAHR